MKVLIYSRMQIENIISVGSFPANTAVITFYDDNRNDKSYSHVNYDNVCPNVYYCRLDDADTEDIVFSRERYDEYLDYADDVAEFIYEAYCSGMDIICQCDYGQSRSAGCAAAIMQHFYGNGIEVFADYNRYPNKLVYNKIYQALEAYKLSKSY